MLVRESASSFQLGDHGTTLGGNPLVAAAALATLRVLDQEVVIENARAMGTRFADGLASLVSDGLAVEIRGRGLMIGIETAGPTAKTAMAIARDEWALLVNAIGDATLRVVPPLTITADEVDEAVTRLRQALQAAAA